MTYSQQPLLDLFRSGALPGETNAPEHIETVISNLFLFPETVYKVYKNNSEFFNTGFHDLSKKVERFSFTRNDYSWNNTLSPSIYTRLVGVSVRGNKLHIGEPTDEADELVFVMKRVDTNDLLFEHFVRGDISSDDCHNIGKQLAEALASARTEQANEYNYYEAFGKRIEDIRAWGLSVTDYWSTEEQAAYCDYMEDYRTQHRELFENDYRTQIAQSGDMHSLNALYTNGQFYLMDSYPPKDEWAMDYELNPLYRFGADLLALTGKQDLYKAFIEGYEQGTGTKADRTLEPLYLVYTASIMTSYLYMLQQTDPSKTEPAKRYHAFLRDYFARIQHT